MCSVNQGHWHSLEVFANAKISSPFQELLNLEIADSFLHLIPTQVNVWEVLGQE